MVLEPPLLLHRSIIYTLFHDDIRKTKPMNRRLKILFVCAMNKQRSATAESLYRNDARLEVRSAGVRSEANRRVSRADLEWADVVLALLLLLPCCALGQLATRLNAGVLAGALIAFSAFTFLAYRHDKRRAAAGAWRIPESTLHLAALFGGWPGAFLAQRAFRHKTAKASFQIVFWAMVLIHQFVAFDSLRAWHFTRDMIRFIQS